MADFCPDLCGPVVRCLFVGRVSVFTVLEDRLGQRFSLDNGMAIQDLIDVCLRRFRAPRCTLFQDPLAPLRAAREPHLIHWEGRDLRVWTWPPHLADPLVATARRLLCILRRGETLGTPYDAPRPRSDCPEGERHRWEGLGDVCIRCIRRAAEDCVDTYKCCDLVDNDGRSIFTRSVGTECVGIGGRLPFPCCRTINSIFNV